MFSRVHAADGEAALLGPTEKLERLYEMACRDQWTVAGLDWSAVDVSGVPAPLRAAGAELFTQAHHGELTAMLAAARLLDRVDDPSARLFLATQVNDEARHTRFFENLLGRLEAPGEVRPSVATLMRSVYEAPTPEGVMLGMQVLIEGVAHSLFTAGARLFEALDAEGELAPPLRTVQQVVGVWLPQLLARDESRHIAFGLSFLTARIPELSLRERDALEAQVHGWGELVFEAAVDPDLLVGVGLDGDAMSRRCIDDLNLRLSQIGLEARLAPP